MQPIAGGSQLARGAEGPEAEPVNCPIYRLGNHPFDPGTRPSLQQIQAIFRAIDLETTPCKGVNPKDRLHPKA